MFSDIFLCLSSKHFIGKDKSTENLQVNYSNKDLPAPDAYVKTLKTTNLQHVIKVRNAYNYTVPVVQKHTRTGPTSQAQVTTAHSTVHIFSHDRNPTTNLKS